MPKVSSLTREVAEFVESMPSAYRETFGLDEVERHASIVARRAAELAHAEAWSDTGNSVCVVADDEPGLLSFVSDALLVHGLNISSAKAYCRRRSDGIWEAVDFFWLEHIHGRGESSAIEPAELSSFAQTLRELIAENHSISQPPRERDTLPVSRSAPSRIYFDLVALRRNEYVLIVETPDFAGLLFAISSAVHGQGIRIVASEIRTERGVARDRFSLAAIDSEPLDGERLCDVQLAVYASVRAGMSRH